MDKLAFRQVHLDFHTSELIPRIGKRFDKKQFQNALKKGHVNSITIFSKCHHGWAYHPTAANEMHPHLDFDLMGEMLEACYEIGVQAPVYLSAGLDEKIARKHPDWLMRSKDESIGWGGNFMNPGYHTFCFNSPYLAILDAQVREVMEKYNPIEIFLDIVSPRICYCQNCIATIRERGLDPRDDQVMLDFAEEVYKKYYETMNSAVHDINPETRVFHNGGHIARGRRDLAFANTHLELESLPTGGWGYDHFPLSARYVQNLGMEFMGMTGKFHSSWGEFGGFKHPNALRYEAALSIANGAKCSIGDQMHPEGFLDDATYELIGAAYSEVEAKEQWCGDVTAVADVGVISTGGAGMSSAKTDAGVSRIMLEGKYLFDVLDLDCDFDKYKVLILADGVTIDGELKTKIDSFIAKGGKLLATGISGLNSDKTSFVYDFGAKYEGENPFRPSYIRPEFDLKVLGQSAYVLYGKGQRISLCGGKQLAASQDPYFNREVFSFSSHQHTPSNLEDSGAGIVQGKDGIYIAWDVFEDYATKGGLICKLLVLHALDLLLEGKKSLTTNLPAQGITTMMKQSGDSRYVAHFLYASPVKRGDGVEVIEDILPIADVEACVQIPEKVKRVYLAPQMEEIVWTEKDGIAGFTIPMLECHQMVVIDY